MKPKDERIDEDSNVFCSDARYSYVIEPILTITALSLVADPTMTITVLSLVSEPTLTITLLSLVV